MRNLVVHTEARGACGRRRRRQAEVLLTLQELTPSKWDNGSTGSLAGIVSFVDPTAILRLV